MMGLISSKSDTVLGEVELNFAWVKNELHAKFSIFHIVSFFT